MQFGIDICVDGGAARNAVRAEKLGFDKIWFADSPAIAGDVFVGMGAAAAVTERLAIGSGVCVPWSRNPLVTASAIASLNAMAPGRIEMAFGTGFSARKCFDLDAMRVDDLAAHVGAVQTLLRGEVAQVNAEGKARGVKILHPQLVNIVDPVGMYIAAGGPRMRALAAELGTGVLDMPAVIASDESSAFSSIKDAWSAAGRDGADLTLAVTLPFVVLRPGEDRLSERIRKVIGPTTMNPVHYWADEILLRGRTLPEHLDSDVQAAVEGYLEVMRNYAGDEPLYLKVHEGHGLFVRDEEAHLVSDALLSRPTVGTHEQLCERIEALEAAGVQAVLFPVMLGQEDAMDDIADALSLEQRRLAAIPAPSGR